MAKTKTAKAQQQPTDKTGGQSVEVQDAQLPEVAEGPAGEASGQIDILLEIPIPVEVQLAQTSLRVRELLQLSAGAVLKLDKQVGEPVDVLLRGVKFATGQLVVVGDRLGVRLDDILSPDPASAAGREQT